jgi:hypothetical protein
MFSWLSLRRRPKSVGSQARETGMVDDRESFEIGTVEWLTQTGGRLSIPQAVVLSAQGLAQAGGDRFRRRRPSPAQSAGQSARVSTARRELAAVLSTQRERVLDRQGQPLLNHACRTFVLGAALLSDDQFGRVNFTAAAVAALAHDDGLVHPSTPGDCFTADSAVEANTMMVQLGASSEDAYDSQAAVVSHFQPKLPREAGPGAQLVALGASADVMGFGLARIDSGIQTEVWQEWPDLDFLSDVRRLLKGERTRAPRTRPGVLSFSGMPSLLRSAR